MANCNFKIPFPASSVKYLQVAENAITSHKGTFAGDDSSGNFKIPVGIGDIVGEYTIADDYMNIHISKKPLLVTCHMIETRLKSYLEGPTTT